MSIRHLDHLFDPTSVVVVGASLREGSLGARAWLSLRAGGFSGARYAVNPKYRELDGEVVYPSLKQLPGPAHLAVLCTPAQTVPGLVAELGERGIRAVVVLSTGMTHAQQQAMLAAAGRHTLRVLGPGSVGLWHPALGLAAGVTANGVAPGDVAFVAQSGAVTAAMLDWAAARNVGFSKCVSLGTQADVDASDALDFLGSDPATKAILLCVERIGDARKFMSAARAAARNKPVMVVKSGRANPAPPASGGPEPLGVPHDAVFDAAIARAGMLRVNTLQDLFLAAEMLTHFRQSTCDGLLVLSNGRGTGVMAADAAFAARVPLMPLSTDVAQRVQTMCPAWGRQSNPVQLPGDASPADCARTLAMLWQQPDAAVLVIHSPAAAVSSADLAQALLAVPAPQPQRLLGCWLGAGEAAQAQQCFRQAGVPVFDTPEQAVKAFAMLRTFRHNQRELMQTPPARSANSTVDAVALRAIVEAVLGSGRTWLTEPEAQALLVAAAVLVATGPERRQGAHGPTVGVSIDPLFGPVVVFGQGDWAEPLGAAMAVALPPLNTPLALALINRTPVGRALSSVEPDAGVCTPAVLAQVLVGVSQLLVDVPELVSLEIHALHPSAQGAAAFGARVRLGSNRPAGAAHFAIQPYPQHLEESTDWQGQPLTLRPIRPEDEAQHLAFLRQVSADDIRMRVFYSRRHIEHTELARLTQIDYTREMAFIATRTTPAGEAETLGVVRATVDPNNDAAEFGVLIRSDLKGGGLGRMLMLKLIAHWRGQGTHRLVGTVLRANVGMLHLAQSLGFDEGPVPDDPDEHDVRFVTLRLQTDASGST